MTFHHETTAPILSHRPAILVTDFGADSAKGRLKAELQRQHHAIFGCLPEILDEVHSIPLGQHLAASWEIGELSEAFAYRKPVVVGVVDLGVADDGRRPIALETENGITFVGPDNGIATRLIELFGIREAVALDPEHRRLPRTKTCTFDGRDLFAIEAGKLLVGERIENLGECIRSKSLQTLSVPPGTVQHTDTVSGIPKFTSFHVGDLGDLLKLLENGKTANFSPEIIVDREQRTEWTRPRRNGIQSRHPVHFKPFSGIPIGENALYAGSSGVPEIAVNGYFANERLDIGIGDQIIVEPA